MTEPTLRRTLEHLERLVAFDTRNPPRAIAGDHGLFAYCRDMLQRSGLTCEIVDLGDGCVYLLAVRGAPQVLFNVHVDTVPADPGWTVDPHRLHVDRDRAVGLGACDIKGAAACLLAVLEDTAGPAAVLFSSDEEAGSSRCVREFLARSGLSSGTASHPTFRAVVVAEPTRCRAVLEHRGIGTATAVFHGVGGHASAARALHDSAVHEAVRWAGLALARAAASEAAPGRLPGLRLNLGAIEGGLKANMIASAATVRFGVRPPPELVPEAALAELFALAPDPARVRFTPGFLAPPLPAGGPERLADARAAAAALAERLGLPLGDPVDFWTEAALFSAAGCDTLVYGPGSIEQAHTAGEYVPLTDLVEAAARYRAHLS
jgi:acetylornithine deacetylase